MLTVSEILNHKHTQAELARLTLSATSALCLNALTAGSTDNTLCSGETTNVKLTAHWYQSLSSTVRYISLRLKRNGTIATGKYVQIRLCEDNNGAPGNTLAVSSRILCSAITASYSLIQFTLSSEVNVITGTTYHILLEGNYTASATNNISWRSKTVTSGGNMHTYNGTTWSATTTKDLEVCAEIPVIIDESYQANDGINAAIANQSIIATTRTADVKDASTNNTLLILEGAHAGTTYYIGATMPDGNGITMLQLSESTFR